MDEKNKKLSEEEMQALRESIVEGVQEYFDSYDWDQAFLKIQENRDKE